MKVNRKLAVSVQFTNGNIREFREIIGFNVSDCAIYMYSACDQHRLPLEHVAIYSVTTQ